MVWKWEGRNNLICLNKSYEAVSTGKKKNWRENCFIIWWMLIYWRKGRVPNKPKCPPWSVLRAAAASILDHLSALLSAIACTPLSMSFQPILALSTVISPYFIVWLLFSLQLIDQMMILQPESPVVFQIHSEVRSSYLGSLLLCILSYRWSYME